MKKGKQNVKCLDSRLTLSSVLLCGWNKSFNNEGHESKNAFELVVGRLDQTKVYVAYLL